MKVLGDNYVLDNCQLEWDRARGMLYVHNIETGATVLRVGGLPHARKGVKLDFGKMIDIDVSDNPHVSVPGRPT